jgi:hypothetical protein
MSKGFVEYVLRLHISRLKKMGIIQPEYWASGDLTWSRMNKQCASIHYSCKASDKILELNFRTRSNYPNSEWEDITQQIELTTTPCNYGGERYWFVCPHCEKRVGCLYNKSGLFLCRDCNDLTYEERNDSKKFRAFKAVFEIDRLYEKLYALRTRTYRGQLTKRAESIYNKLERKRELGAMSVENINNLLSH